MVSMARRMAWAWPSSVNTTVATWQFPSHFVASSISDGVLYHVKCQYQCWPENRQRGPSVAKFCTSVLTSSVLASGHWPVPLKQLVQISVQKLIKEVFWSVEHQIIQQFSYLPKKHQSPGCIHKEEWVTRELVWLVRSCTTELYKQLYHHQLYKRHRHKHVAIQQVPDFFIWKPTLLWTLHV